MYAEILKILTLSMANFHCPKLGSAIKNRIRDYDFQENQDFICVSQKNETQRADGQIGVAVSNEYYITLDMAKELSMVERNEKLRGLTIRSR